MKTICGIYIIKNKINNKVYIGGSVTVYGRWLDHKKLLNKNKHPIKLLQEDWNKYGKQNFEFKVIEECNKNILIEKEQYYMDSYKSLNLEFGYNNRMAGNNGKHSEESKLKMSNSQKNKKTSNETKLKISNSLKGLKHSNESIIKHSNSMKNRWSDIEHIKKHTKDFVTINQYFEIVDSINSGIKLIDISKKYGFKNSNLISKIKYKTSCFCKIYRRENI